MAFSLPGRSASKRALGRYGWHVPAGAPTQWLEQQSAFAVHGDPYGRQWLTAARAGGALSSRTSGAM
jgi:hypothetical protein